MGLEDVQVFKACFLACCCFWVIFGAVAIPLSLKSMEQGKYAVELYWGSQQIAAEPVTQPGMRFVGLGNGLLEYPSTYQTMYFTASTKGVQAQTEGQFKPIVRGPLRARSADGLEMYVTTSFQWRLQPAYLTKLYHLLGEEMYRDEFVRFARAAIIEVCAQFPADMYFTNRTQILAVMDEQLRASFSQTERGFVIEIKGVQLQEVDLPDEFDAEIANTQAQMQEYEVAVAERIEKELAMTTDLKVATQEVRQRLEAAQGLAQSIRLANQAEVAQQLIFHERQAQANNEILALFENDSDPYARLFELMEIRAIAEHTQKHMMFSIA
eukprot:TRINITY_DN41186_c0_g1_i1.p1 TRINITY_DN41186_c0_g1~~TRINITY_DN41186_c0_g1_i1.p1  ORF type:complete len:325 (-),score=66.35 TRINITY_DN41186_c0_g1_i1:173-1147(-)